MLIVGVEGPSYAGKSILSVLINRHLLEQGFKSMVFPCYMNSIDTATRQKMPLDQFITTDQEIEALNYFLEVESQRKSEINLRSDLDFVILDRTTISLRGHNYALSELTKEKFYALACELMDERKDRIVQPEIFIYVNTLQKNLTLRYPPMDKTLFTNSHYNDLFKKYYYSEVDKAEIIKRSFEVGLNNIKDIPIEVERCCKELTLLK